MENTEEKPKAKKIKTEPLSKKEIDAHGEQFKEAIEQEIKTVNKIFADGVTKTKYILKRTFPGGAVKNDLIALHKSGKGFIFNRSKSFGVELPDMGVKAK